MKLSAGSWPAVRRLLELGLRSRSVVVGVEAVRGAVQKGRLRLALLASDASPNSAAKVRPLLEARSVTLIVGPASAILGDLTGRTSVVVVGIVDRHLSDGILALAHAAPSDNDE